MGRIKVYPAKVDVTHDTRVACTLTDEHFRNEEDAKEFLEESEKYQEYCRFLGLDYNKGVYVDD